MVLGSCDDMSYSYNYRCSDGSASCIRLFFIVQVSVVCVCVGVEIFASGILSSVLHIMKFHFVN